MFKFIEIEFDFMDRKPPDISDCPVYRHNVTSVWLPQSELMSITLLFFVSFKDVLHHCSRQNDKDAITVSAKKQFVWFDSRTESLQINYLSLIIEIMELNEY